MRRLVFAAVTCLTVGFGAVQAQDRSGAVADLIQNAAVKAALASAKASEAKTIEDQIRICQIPAPPFKEKVRGEELKRDFSGARAAERPRRQSRQRDG